MRFMLPESAKNYFSNIMRREGSHTSDEKNNMVIPLSKPTRN